MRRRVGALLAVAALVLVLPGPAAGGKKKKSGVPVATGSTEAGPLSLAFRASDGAVPYWSSVDGNRRVCTTLANLGRADVSLNATTAPGTAVVGLTVPPGATRVACGSLDGLEVTCTGGGSCSVAWRVDSLEALP